MSKDAIIGFHILKNGNEAKLHADGSISISSHPKKIQFSAEEMLLRFQAFEMKYCIIFTVENILDTEIGVYNQKTHSIDKLTYPHPINFVIPISDTELFIAGPTNPDNPQLPELETSVSSDLDDCCITSSVSGSSLVFCRKNGETGNIPIPFLNEAVSYLVHESHKITGLPKSLNIIIANYYGFFSEKNSNSPEKRNNTVDLPNESELPGMVI